MAHVNAHIYMLYFEAEGSVFLLGGMEFLHLLSSHNSLRGIHLSDVQNAKRLGLKTFYSRSDKTDPFKRLQI